MGSFPEPMEGTVIFAEEKVYACLASEPIVEGHTIVVWREEVEDISHLSSGDYLHLMRMVNMVRDVLLEAFNTTKVYLAYLDETRHIHWHLFPRKEGNEIGFSLMAQPKRELTDLSMMPILQSLILKRAIF